MRRRDLATSKSWAPQASEGKKKKITQALRQTLFLRGTPRPRQVQRRGAVTSRPPRVLTDQLAAPGRAGRGDRDVPSACPRPATPRLEGGWRAGTGSLGAREMPPPHPLPRARPAQGLRPAARLFPRGAPGGEGRRGGGRHAAPGEVTGPGAPGGCAARRARVLPRKRPRVLATHPRRQIRGGDAEPHRLLLVLQEGERPAQAGGLAAAVPADPEEPAQGDEDPAEAQPQVAQHIHGEDQYEAPRKLRHQTRHVHAQQRRRLRHRVPSRRRHPLRGGGIRGRPRAGGLLSRGPAHAIAAAVPTTAAAPPAAAAGAAAAAPPPRALAASGQGGRAAAAPRIPRPAPLTAHRQQPPPASGFGAARPKRPPRGGCCSAGGGRRGGDGG